MNSKNHFALVSFFVLLFVSGFGFLSCQKDNKQEPEPDNGNGNTEQSSIIFPAVVSIDYDNMSVEKCDTTNGEYILGFNGKVPTIKKGSVVVVEDKVVLVTDAKTEGNLVKMDGKLGDLSYVFHNTSFTLTTGGEEPETKSSISDLVFYPSAIIEEDGTKVETKSDSFEGDDFRLWDKTYTKTFELYKEKNSGISVTPTLSSSMNVAFVLEFLDETKNMIDDIAFIKAKQFKFSGHLYGNASASLDINAFIKASKKNEGKPERIEKNFLPSKTLTFWVGYVPIFIKMGCDLMGKVGYEFSGDLNADLHVGASVELSQGIKYMPYSSYDVLDKWSRLDFIKDTPAPHVTGHGSFNADVYVYPRFYAKIDYFLGPCFEIKPYAKASLGLGFEEGNIDPSKDYLSNTASAHVGFDASVGVCSFLENFDVNPELGIIAMGNMVDWTALESPSSIKLLSSSTSRLTKGYPTKLKYQVNEKCFGDEYASTFFPIIKIDIPRANERYYLFPGINGQAEFERIPKSSDEIIFAIIYDAKGKEIDRVQFGDGTVPDASVFTGEAYSITKDSADIPVSIDSENPILDVGVVCSETSSEPTISDKKFRSGTTAENVNVSLSGLEPATKYYCRGYAVIDNGVSSKTVLGNTVSFTTKEVKKPVIELSQSSISFGNVIKGQTAKVQLVIYNRGEENLYVNMDSPSAPFGIDWKEATIGSGQSKTLTVSFNPTEVRDYGTLLQIKSNAENGTQRVQLTGSGQEDPGAAFFPVLSVSSENLNFGDVIIGESSVQNITISNVGKKVLRISSISCPSGFKSDWTSASINAGSSKTLKVTFTPTSNKSYSGSLQINSDSSTGSTKTISLTGNGLPKQSPIMTLSETSLKFGDQTVNTQKSKTLTITNTGTGSLTVSGISKTSTYGDVVSISGWTSGGTIASGESKSITVSFLPTKAQSYSETLTITSSNASNSQKQTVSISGTGIEEQKNANIEVSSNSVSFGSVYLGSSSVKSITISNTGDKALDVSSVSCPDGYSVDWTGASISAGTSKILKITFSPNSIKTYSGSLVIKSNSSTDSTKEISLSGKGIEKPKPVMTLSSTVVDFGEQIKFSSESKTITITNTGTGTLEISSITKTKNYGDLFSLSGWTQGGSIAAGESKTITINFQPMESRNYEETLTIQSSNATNAQKQTVTLRGSGIEEPKEISVSPSSLNFSEVPLTYVSNKTLSIKNNGSSNMKVSSLSISKNDGNCFKADWEGGTIAPGATKKVNISFEPKELRSYSGQITISSDATNGEQTVPLSGVGVVDENSDIKFSVDELRFGNVLVDDRSHKNFDIINSGSSTITITSITAPEGFEITNWTDGYTWGFVEGYSRSVAIEFRPTEYKYYSGDVIVKTSSGITKRLPVSGTGIEAKGNLEITSGTSLDFGDVSIGASGSLFARLHNSGDAPLTITGIDCPDGFSAEANVSKISAGANTSLYVYFTPTQAKSYSGSVILKTDGENGSASIEVSGKGIQSSTNGDFVDMGLSVKWATTNVGAAKPEEYGHYVSWAETETKQSYTWKTYKYYNVSTYLEETGWITKYCNNSDYGYNGFTDALSMLKYEDDYANAKLGGLARIPTSKEWKELKQNCDWQWTARNGINGYLVTSRINGNSIFLPASGQIEYKQDYLNEKGYYWASDLHPLYSPDIYVFEIYSDRANTSSLSRHIGLTVRAVEDYTAKPMIYTYTRTLSFTGVKIGTSSSKTIAITNIGKGTLHISDITVMKHCAVDWTSASIEPGSYKMLTITYTPVEDPYLVIDDELTWDYRTVKIYSDARNGTGSDNYYGIEIVGYGVQ